LNRQSAYLRRAYRAVTADDRPFLVFLDTGAALSLIIGGSIAATHLGWPTDYGRLADNIAFALGMSGIFASISIFGTYVADFMPTSANVKLGVALTFAILVVAALNADAHSMTMNFGMRASVWTALLAIIAWRLVAPCITAVIERRLTANQQPQLVKVKIER
jgi:hypothetical protein